jgi:hypothetical protein
MKKILILLFAALAVWSCKERTAIPELICVEVHDLYGYINIKGEMVIAPQFESALPFSDGLARVELEDEGYGFINTKGRLVNGLKGLHSATPFSGGLAVIVRPLECPEVINTSGKVLFRMPYAKEVYPFYEGLSLFSSEVEIATKSGNDENESADHDLIKETLYGFVNTSGKVVIPAKLKKAYPFFDGLSIAMSDDYLYGFMDMKGRWVVEPAFEEALPFSEGLAAVRDKATGLWGFIDRKGMMKIQPQFKECGSFREGLAYASTGKLGGYINKKGLFVIQPQFEGGSSFSQGFATVGINDGIGGVIDKKGVVKYPGIGISPFKGPYAIADTIIDGDVRDGIIDKKGNYVVNPIYDIILWDDLSEFDEDMDYEYSLSVWSNFVDMTWLETGGEWYDNPYAFESDIYTFDSTKRTVKKFVLERDKTLEGTYSFRDRGSMVLSYNDGTSEELDIDVRDQRIKVDKKWYYSTKGTAYDERMRREYKLTGGTWFYKENSNQLIWCYPESYYNGGTATSIYFYEFPEGIAERNDGSYPLSEASRTVKFSVKNGRDLKDSYGKQIAKIESHWPNDGFSVSGDTWYSGSYGNQ